MPFKDYSTTPASNTTIGDNIYVGPNMARNDVREALQTLAADGRDLYNTLQNAVDTGDITYYETTAEALTVTEEGDLFGVEDDGLVSIYRHDPGPVATFLWSVATTAALAADTGYTMIGGLDQQIINLESNRYWTNTEYLSTFRTPLTEGGGATVVMSGTSMVAGTALNPGYVPDDFLVTLAGDYGVDVLIAHNRGQGGKTTPEWVATYLAGDLAIDADLYIFYWGTNDPDTALDPWGDLTVDQAIAAYETALTTFREAKPLSQPSGTDAASGLIIAPPGAIGRGRTDAWFKEFSERLRPLADEYDCAFFDGFSFARDAIQNINEGWDDVYGNGTGAVHMLDALASVFWGEIGHKLFRDLGPNKGNHFHNNRGYTGLELAAATLPAAFEYGMRIDRAYLAQGFPADGFVVTFKNRFNDTNALQIFWDTTGVQFRVGGAIWLSWATFSSTSSNATAGTGFTQPGTSENMAVLRSGPVVVSKGFFTKTAPGTLTAAQNVGTIPVGYRPAIRQWNVKLQVFQASDSTFEIVRGYVDTDGSMVTLGASTKTCDRLYFSETWSAG